MPEIVTADITLTDDQIRQLPGPGGFVAVRDARGNAYGSFRVDVTPAEVIAELLERRKNRSPYYYTHEQVRRHLRAVVAERTRLGGGPLAPERVGQLLDELEAEDPPRTDPPGGAT